MTIEQLSLNNENLRQFISQNSSCIFSSLDWYKVLESGFNSKILVYGLKEGETLQLVIVGILLDFKIVKMFYSNIPYGGFIGNKEFITDFLPLLEKKLKKVGIGIFRVCKQFTDGYDDLNGYRLQKGCQQIKVLEGLSEEENWQKYKKRTRRDIRKAEKSGVRVKEITERKQIEVLYELYLKTMKRNKSCPVWARKALYAIYDNLVLKDKADIFFAELNENLIAGVISVYSRNTSYYFMSASDTEYLTYCPNDLLLHNVISNSISEGKECIDLMTSSESDMELIKFKDKWGTERYPFCIFEKDLLPVRAKIWTWCWRIANSRTGAFLITSLRS
jgi:lipid II:glycine glycyltransferase (peptidoglycan interpeptide bridge formation enzyme)